MIDISKIAEENRERKEDILKAVYLLTGGLYGEPIAMGKIQAFTPVGFGDMRFLVHLKKVFEFQHTPDTFALTADAIAAIEAEERAAKWIKKVEEAKT